MRRLGNDFDLALFLHPYAFFLHHGDRPRAEALARESLDLAQKVEMNTLIPGILDCLGMLAQRRQA